MPQSLASTALALDVAAYRAVRGQAVHSAVVQGALALSHFGEHALGWLTIGAIGTVVDPPVAAPGHGRPSWRTPATSRSSVVRRPRPDLPDLPARTRTPSALSFPVPTQSRPSPW